MKELNSRIIEKIDEIYKIIRNNYSKVDNIGLASGLGGVLLFLFYYYKLTQNKKVLKLAFQMLDETISFLNEGEILLSFCNGIAGLGWLIEHLEQNNFIKGDTNTILKDVDDFIFEGVKADMEEYNYDFLHGALGKALYLLKRKNVNTNCLENITNGILKISECPLPNQLRWKSMHFETQEIIYNLSLSHGIASTINIYSRLYEQDIMKVKSKEIIDKSINYLLTCKKNNMLSFFPNYAVPDGNQFQSSRLAWCYGDLGIGVTLWQVSQKINDKVLENKSLEILLHSTKRRELKENFVFDAGLCHGTSGIAHIFNRIYRNTGIKEFKESSEFWFYKTMEMARFEDGLAGYKYWQSWNNDWYNEIGFLNGITGIGLTLISAASDIDPKWDECLLLS